MPALSRSARLLDIFCPAVAFAAVPAVVIAAVPAVAIAAVLMTGGTFAAPAFAADAPRAPAHKAVPTDPAIAELQRAFDSAVRQARVGSSLDNAYELLSLADTAAQYNADKIVAGAGTAFADLVRRATAAAMKPNDLKSSSVDARDTLDQFVDLRSAAYSVPAAQDALDEGMRMLFPAVAGTIARNAAAAPTWEARLNLTADLALLQASAVQVKMTPTAHDLGAAFDSGLANLRQANEQETDTDLRARHATALLEAAKARDEHLKDAQANTIDIIAQRMKDAPGESPSSGLRLKD